MTTTPNPRTATCATCGETISRTFADERWSSAKSGDVCLAKSDLNRLHVPADEPDTTCPCGNGPFFYVPTRQHPELCGDCSADADRAANGWNPENSID